MLNDVAAPGKNYYSSYKSRYYRYSRNKYGYYNYNYNYHYYR